jgi:hypothetical protein
MRSAGCGRVIGGPYFTTNARRRACCPTSEALGRVRSEPVNLRGHIGLVITGQIANFSPCHGPDGRGASGGGRWRGVDRAHPAGHTPPPHLARRGRDSSCRSGSNQSAAPDQSAVESLPRRCPARQVPPVMGQEAPAGVPLAVTGPQKLMGPTSSPRLSTRYRLEGSETAWRTG